MIINDCVYGRFQVKEPILLSLLKSPSVQRLKKINQYGLPPEMHHWPGFTRYDHSVGAMLLLRSLGASVEEQAAGLLHDISHTAFSHVADLVFDVDFVGGSCFQDENHEKFIARSELPKILKKYGLNWRKIARFEGYNLLENDAPDLCADRVDYALREFYYWANRGAAFKCFKALRVFKGKMVFASEGAALLFANNYLKCQVEHWAETESALRSRILAQILKQALRSRIISKADFYKHDEHIMKLLRKSKNAEIRRLLCLLRGRLSFVSNVRQPEFVVKEKFRFVDPEFIYRGKLVRLSKSNPEFKKRLEKERRKCAKGIRITLLKK